MFRNYLLVAIRNLRKNKLYSVINILGLALGICFTLLIALYIFSERSVNSGLRHARSQYLVKSSWKIPNLGLDITTLAPLPRTLREEYPSQVAGYYSYNPVTNVVSANNRYFKEDISIGDTSLVSQFGFALLYGNPSRAFADNQSAVVTARLAIRLFGKTNVIGERISVQTLVNNEKQDFLVSAVLKDLPRNSVTGLLGDDYGLFVPFSGNRYYAGGDPSQSWQNPFHVGYVELQPGVTPADLEQPLRKLVSKYAPDGIRENLVVQLVPLSDYYQKANNGAVEKMMFTLSLVGLFILAMAVINFVNLSIGTSFGRLKEIGLRKVLGGRKAQLVFQFLSESWVLTACAAILALLGCWALRPVFNQMLSAAIPPLTGLGWQGLLIFFVAVTGLGLLAGLYPALVLSASGIAVAVRGKLKHVRSGILVRKTLLVVQFSLTIIVFVAAVAISGQVNHIFNKDLGYNREQLLVVTAFPKQWDSAGVRRIESVKQQLEQLPVVRSATVSFEVPDRKPPATIPLLPVGGKSAQPLSIITINADEDFAETYQLRLVAGKFLNKGQGLPVPGSIVLNETAVRALGMDPVSAIGRQVHFPAGQGSYVTVAGVIADYHYSSVEQGIEPLAFMHINDYLSYRYLTLRIKPGNMAESLAAVESAWKKASPDSPFEYFFMDEKFASLYRSELQLKQASGLATFLNLLIVLMGVFGVVAFTLARRTREIAVRKVLGASPLRIARLFLREYGITILLANLIAWPAAYLVIEKWLEHYPYRIQPDGWMFAAAGGAVLLLAFLLITLQCLRAAGLNPAATLRTD